MLILIALSAVFFEIRKVHSYQKGTQFDENAIAYVNRLPFPSMRPGGLAFPLSVEVARAVTPDTMHPLFSQAQIAYAYRIHSSVDGIFNIGLAKNKKELGRKCHEFLIGQNAGDICDAMIEANIAVINGMSVECAYAEYEKKIMDKNLRDPNQKKLKELYKEELKQWEKRP